MTFPLSRRDLLKTVAVAGLAAALPETIAHAGEPEPVAGPGWIVGQLQQVTKGVFAVDKVSGIPDAVRQAFALACSCEPGPVAVVIPYPLFIESCKFNCPPAGPPPPPFDEDAFQKALQLLSNRKVRIGIYAGLGCMNYAANLVAVAETLQAPVATSVSGKGVISE